MIQFSQSDFLQTQSAMFNIIVQRFSLLVAILSLVSLWAIYSIGEGDKWYRDEQFAGWYVGFFIVANCLGTYLVHVTNDLFDKYVSKSGNTPIGGIPSWLGGVVTGILERSFFAVAVAFNLGGAVVAMIGWTTIKNTAVWQHLIAGDKKRIPDTVQEWLQARGLSSNGLTDQQIQAITSDHAAIQTKTEQALSLVRPYCALLLGFFSMFIALLGGVIWRSYPLILDMIKKIAVV